MQHLHHGMKTFLWNGGTAPPFLTSAVGEGGCSASQPWQNIPPYQLVVFRAFLDTVEKRKISWSCPKSNLDSRLIHTEALLLC
jgi:hypothetical protein